MAKSANWYARIEPELKERAESIISALGIPASNAITRQIAAEAFAEVRGEWKF